MPKTKAPPTGKPPATRGVEFTSIADVNLRWLKEVYEKFSDEPTLPEVAKKAASDINEFVAPGGKPLPYQESLFKWASFPTDMARVSPFFPMRPKDLKDRPFLKNLPISAAGWGSLTYTGYKLSIHEEDVMLAILALLEFGHRYRQQTTGEDGKKTYTYIGSLRPILRVLGHKKPGVREYRRVIDSLKLLAVAAVDIQIPASKKGVREARFTSMSAILSHVSWDSEKKLLSVTINPFFYEMYIAGSVTLIDVAKRMSLSGEISKALHRFIQSHRGNPAFSGHFLTLAQVLNIDTEQPAFRLRRLIKLAVNELIRNGILTKKSRFINADIIQLYRSDQVSP